MGLHNLLALTTLILAILPVSYGFTSLEQCAGRAVMVTEVARVGEDVVNITAPACPGYASSPHPIDISQTILARHVNDAREASLTKRANLSVASTSPSECINPSICQCGQACAVTCTNFDPTLPLPTVGDCSKLISIMRSFGNTIGPTFVQSTAFPNPIIIAFSTCSSAFGNTRSDGGLIEYCWDALADNISSILNGCIAPGIDPAGECASINGFWAMSTSGLKRVS